MNSIEALDLALSTLFQGFSAVADGLKFNPLCELDDANAIAAQQYPGIYMIEIKVLEGYDSFKAWASWFHGEWVRPEYERMHVPNPKKKRLAAHTELAEWVPLYIGKSKYIADRVWEHIHLKLEQPTTGMKIGQRLNMVNQRFRLSTIRVEVENYDLIMPKLEAALRNKYNPLLGRQ